MSRFIIEIFAESLSEKQRQEYIDILERKAYLEKKSVKRYESDPSGRYILVAEFFADRVLKSNLDHSLDEIQDVLDAFESSEYLCVNVFLGDITPHEDKLFLEKLFSYCIGHVIDISVKYLP